jgi:isopentenyl diphosphate isomerase/L-lactate dehydrogenase-like FMN-dependent dehydrogenase
MLLDQRFPSIDDIERRAQRRIPGFSWEYLRGGIGRESCLRRNREALDTVLFDPCYLPEALADRPVLGVELLGRTYDLPFGISPIGLSGLMWPGAVEILAGTARDANIPMGLSHFATTHMREFRAISGANGWFQFYPARDRDLRHAMIAEITATGFDELVVTVDIPTATRRDRELRVGLSVPPAINLSTICDVASRPQWAAATLREGVPTFKNLAPYIPKGLSMAEQASFLTDMIEGHVTRAVLRDIREQWKGRLIVKGLMTVADARTALECGADGVWISNHGARQLDAARSPVEVLPAIRAALGPKVPIMADGGPRTGLDIARMLALGADFVFLGRAFVFAVAALGARGGDHAVHILREELRCTMAQIGCTSVRELPQLLSEPSERL